MLVLGFYLTRVLIFEVFLQAEMASKPCELCADSYGNRITGHCRFSWPCLAASAECGRSRLLSCLLDFKTASGRQPWPQGLQFLNKE